ncbi:hypothetical protein FB567DRAFT_628778 [Paraphoma chrysanthemicola]|uniref:DUF7730 domain-containing protein n=1 Tax=Paraphoma chrysanthemicola TaxID=798071 RepID=A0A8K0R4L1_9PLEO|nr:hypothetical protein FB567DRAFT_628778 [Paraphoma chrysanthemicola]
MAPRTRASATTPDSAAPVKQDNNKPTKRPAPKMQSEDRAAKRPARGYHTFKNGMLNVAPKGNELALVKSNQNSPLLQLPPEIRNHIWKLVLVGMVFRQQYKNAFIGQRYVGRSSRSVLKNKPHDAKNAMAMLQVCRQLYAECAALPYSVNQFASEFYWMEAFSTALRRLRAHQRSHITDILFEFGGYSTWSVNRFSSSWLSTARPGMGLPKLLPNLQRIQICFFKETQPMPVSFEDLATLLRSKVEADMTSNGYELSIKRLEKDFTVHENEWRSPPPPATDAEE